jgi:hypothetical protein
MVLEHEFLIIRAHRDIEMGCDEGRWIELAQELNQWQTLVSALLNLLVLLKEEEVMIILQIRKFQKNKF